jgi:hypothetical protein
MVHAEIMAKAEIDLFNKYFECDAVDHETCNDCFQISKGLEEIRQLCHGLSKFENMDATPETDI